ncbi:MAG: DUF6498-containing protein [Candidatus Cloacimonetes bacterium]|nr:DUF6498-containing protein [Candidatus Cloacimonadota bacterium]
MSNSINKREIIFDIIAFCITIIVVIIFDWQVRDVIWSLWTSSLCVGYAFIVTLIISSIYFANSTERLQNTVGGVFLLAFFTFHFGMFHFVHSVFLNGFFPLIQKSNKFPNFFVTIITALKSYWPFVLTTFVSRFSDFQFNKGNLLESKDMIMKPYVNVVRMHLLIFVFAGLYALRIAHFAIYPVLFTYFLPWKKLLQHYKYYLKQRSN